MNKVMVLGANGRFGRAAVLAFAAAGWQVLAQLRRAPRAPLPAGVVAVQADALAVDTLAAAAQAAGGVDVIVNALNPPYTQWAELLPPITAATLALARATGATLMLPGNVYNFGRALPPALTEATPFVADHAKAAQRIAVEAALVAAAQPGAPGLGSVSAVRSIVIRAGDFLGDAGTWVDLAMAKGLVKRPHGRFTHMGPADLPHAWAWLPDLAQTFVQVAGLRATLAPHTVLHHAGLTLTGAQLQAAFEAELGRSLQAQAFPWWALRLASPFAPMLRALVQMRYLWQRPHRLDDARLRALLTQAGLQPAATPLAQVVQGVIAALPPALRPAGQADAGPGAAAPTARA